MKFDVKNTFYVPSRGLMLAGQITEGTPRLGPARLQGAALDIDLKIIGIEGKRTLGAGDHASLLIRGYFLKDFEQCFVGCELTQERLAAPMTMTMTMREYFALQLYGALATRDDFMFTKAAELRKIAIKEADLLLADLEIGHA